MACDEKKWFKEWFKHPQRERERETKMLKHVRHSMSQAHRASFEMWTDFISLLEKNKNKKQLFFIFNIYTNLPDDNVWCEKGWGWGEERMRRYTWEHRCVDEQQNESKERERERKNVCILGSFSKEMIIKLKPPHCERVDRQNLLLFLFDDFCLMAQLF